MWVLTLFPHTHIYTYTHTHNGIFLSHKIEWNLAIRDNTDRPRGYYAKWKKEKDKYCMISFIWNLKNKDKWKNITKQSYGE